VCQKRFAPDIIEQNEKKFIVIMGYGIDDKLVNYGVNVDGWNPSNMFQTVIVTE
jgi:hypothetical protein